MIHHIKRIVKGARYSEQYGSHPGTPVLIGMIFCGAMAGLSRGGEWWAVLLGAACAATVFGPLWLLGCWERGE